MKLAWVECDTKKCEILVPEEKLFISCDVE